MSSFRIKASSDQQYYFVLKAGNGETILTSERYTVKGSAHKGIESVRVNAPLDSRYDRRESPSGFRFNLKAANGEIIGTSEIYTTRQAREVGISSVKLNAPSAPVIDET